MTTGFNASGVIYFRNLIDEWYRVDLESLPEKGELLSPIAPLEHEDGTGWTAIGDDICCSGGAVFDPEIYQHALSKTLYKLDSTKNPHEWEPISCDRKFPHHKPFMFAINRKIYVIGGKSLNYRVNRVHLDSEDEDDQPPEEVPVQQWTYGGEVYDLDTQTWNGVASTWEQFTDFCGAPAARLDKDRVVFYSFRCASLLFYNAATDELFSEHHPDFTFGEYGVLVLEGLQDWENFMHTLVPVTEKMPAVVYDSTLYWLNSDLHLYGYDFVKRRWLRSKNSLDGSFWPFRVDYHGLTAMPLLLNLDNNGTFLAIHHSGRDKLGIASLAVHKEDDSLTVSVQFRHTIAVDPTCLPREGTAMLKNVGSSSMLGEGKFTMED